MVSRTVEFMPCGMISDQTEAPLTWKMHLDLQLPYIAGEILKLALPVR